MKDEAPELWALRFEHPCRDFDFRQWATDVGLTTKHGEGVDVAITVRHWILPTYIGEEPEGPQPSAPRIVSDLLQLSNTIAHDVIWPVSPEPHVLRPGGGASFKKWLESSDRVLGTIEELIKEREDEIRTAWRGHFDR